MSDSKRILIIRLSSIGDIVLTSPVIRCVKQQLEGVELHYLTKKQNHSVLSANPYIDKIHLFNGELSETLNALRSEKFDFIIDLHNNLRSNLITKRLGVPSKAFHKLNLKKWLFTTWKWNRLPKEHIVDRYLAAANSLGVINDTAGLDFFIANKNVVDLSQLLPELSQDFVAYAIGGLHATKRLPTAKIAKLCQQIEQDVVLLGGPDDRETAKEILDLIGEEQAIHRVFHLCGQLNLQQSASVIKQSKLVICHDSGLMHIAAALDKEIRLIWGNTHPDFGMYPYPKSKARQSKAQSFQVELSCRPCSKIGYEKCPKGHFRCMNDHDLTTIAKSIP